MVGNKGEILYFWREKHFLIILKHLVPTSKKTQHFSITKINWLKQFKEIVAIYSENHIKPINNYTLLAKCRIADG
jgi:hypothetical protein